MNTYSVVGRPYETTLLTYRPVPTIDAWTDVWVKEGDVDDRDDLVCFRIDGSIITICPQRQVYIYKPEIIRWRSPPPLTITDRTIRKIRQKTVYIRTQVGVDARFRPAYEQGAMNNV